MQRLLDALAWEMKVMIVIVVAMVMLAMEIQIFKPVAGCLL
jgi:hypothetical protein